MMVTIPPTTAPTMIPVGSELSDLEYKNKASSLNLMCIVHVCGHIIKYGSI